MKKYTGKHKKFSAGIVVVGLAFCSMALAQTSPESTAAGNSPQAILEQQAPENNSAAQEAIENVSVNTQAPKAAAPADALQKPVTTLPTAPRINSGASLLNLGLGLGLILLLIFALAWLARRMGQGGMLGNSHIKVVAAMPLGTRERLLVVDVGGQQLLLGITATQINTLHVFPEPVIDKAEAAGHSEFGKKLIAILQQKTSAQTSQPEQEKESR